MAASLRLPLLLAALALSGCGSVSGLTRESGAAPMRIADYTRVEVADFTSSEAPTFDDEKKRADYEEGVARAKVAFADKIAEEVRASGAFESVSRTPGPRCPGTGECRERQDAGSGRPALRVGGDIRRYDEGNVAARALTGFAGQAHFDATVEVADAESGLVLATLTVDRNSWPLPIGASTNLVQNPNLFMNQAAKKMASELAAKKGVAAPQR
jgi:hypothetical protein